MVQERQSDPAGADGQTAERGTAMRGISRGLVLATGAWALVLAGAGAGVAQENLDQGKSGAQLYAADCAICHKAPQKLDLGRAGGLFGLDSFLREHYTASRESAAAISAYLKGIHREAPPAPGRAHKQNAKGGHEKPVTRKPAEEKPPQAKPAEKKSPVKKPI